MTSWNYEKRSATMTSHLSAFWTRLKNALGQQPDFAINSWVRIKGEKEIWFIEKAEQEQEQWIYTLGSPGLTKQRILAGPQIEYV
jgi:hypothetical protein